MTHGVKMPLCMLEFSSSKIIYIRFHVNSDIGELVIVYDMIIGRELMVKKGLLSDFTQQVLQWDGITIPVK